MRNERRRKAGGDEQRPPNVRRHPELRRQILLNGLGGGAKNERSDEDAQVPERTQQGGILQTATALIGAAAATAVGVTAYCHWRKSEVELGKSRVELELALLQLKWEREQQRKAVELAARPSQINCTTFSDGGIEYQKWLAANVDGYVLNFSNEGWLLHTASCSAVKEMGQIKRCFTDVIEALAWLKIRDHSCRDCRRCHAREDKGIVLAE